MRLEAGDEAMMVCTTLHWSRLLFDYFRSELGKEPIVVDAEDVVHNTKATTIKLCDLLGIDPGGVQETWEEGEFPGDETARVFMEKIVA